ncbi:SRPBCC family protein [Streptomyces sp. GC420]|uniref:SRPBCC family protein n=1 Tax=Streptomyces sp. GC420 TaxID=2697568 RepID=UPI0014151B8D|nr:SRPBCC family protein [Streptomyces sp. GC420]NBM18492.1 SRPBCC family protein [Streptomyces sp. GC420]
MALFRLEHLAPLTVDEAWRRVTDWERHGGAVPLTRVTVASGRSAGRGTVFVARTGAGPLGFDDPMEVVEWSPPAASGGAGRCRLEKRGHVVTGWAEIEVRPHTARTSRVVWTESVRVRGVPAFLDPPLARAGRLMFRRALAVLLADVGTP